MSIASLNQANDAIKDLYRLKRDIAAEEVILNDAIEKLKEKSLEVTAPLSARYALVESELLDYIKKNKKEICREGKKSIDLLYGKIGIEDSRPGLTQLKGFTKDDTAKLLLKSPSFKHCAKVTYSYIKDAVRALNLPAEKLARFGLRLTQSKDKPYFTFNEAKLSEE